MRNIKVFIVFIFAFVHCAKAETVRISNPSELSNLKSLKPGDEIIIASGIYNSVKMDFSANGTELLPIVLKGENPGGVIFTGESLLRLSGSFIIVKNLFFRDISPLNGKSLIEFKCNDSRLSNCVISGNNTVMDATNESKWVSLYGERNTVEKCSFIEKKNIGCLLVVWLEKNVIPGHKILNNYFSRPTILKTEDGEKMNGQECIRIGTSDYSMQTANCLVKGNMFYRCDSEMEVISNKSCYNSFLGNLFIETQGALTLRHGNNSLVEGNFFIGNNREGTAGVRVIGDHQTVKNNYFENGRGKNYQAAICLIQGVLNSPLNRYFQVKNCLIESNVIVNCYNGIVISYGSAADQTLPVISTEINKNIIYNDLSSNYSIVWVDKPQEPQVTFSENVIYGGQSNNFDDKLSPSTSKKPVIDDVTNKWQIINNNSGADWAQNLKNF